MMYLPRTWPVGISLLTDESFSSWFARIAWAHGATPSELYRIALPGGRIGGIDLDRHACDDLILNLSRHAGIPAEALEAATLMALEIAPRLVPGKVITAFVMASLLDP